MRSLLVASGLSIALLVPAMAETNRSPVQLVLHRAVYDLSLLRSEGSRGLDSARGRIAMDFGGNACEGYTLTYRQVTVLDSNETGSRTVDTRTATFEAGDGQSMRFKSTSSMQGLTKDGVDGDAKLTPDGTLTFVSSSRRMRPSRRWANRFSRPSISAPHRGRTQGPDHAVRAGLATVRTTARRSMTPRPGRAPDRAGSRDQPEEAARQDVLANSPRWPVTISYFTEGAGRADTRLHDLLRALREWRQPGACSITAILPLRGICRAFRSRPPRRPPVSAEASGARSPSAGLRRRTCRGSGRWPPPYGPGARPSGPPGPPDLLPLRHKKVGRSDPDEPEAVPSQAAFKRCRAARTGARGELGRRQA